MKSKKLLSLLLTLAIILGTAGFCIPATAATVTDDIATTASLKAYDQFIERIMNTKDISGVAYVTQDGYVLAQYARGMQNTNENKKMTIDSLFPLGSVSKQFCAVAILLLQEDGKLSVYDTLDKYFPEYEIGKDITVQNLLTMRSGIRDHVNIDYSYEGNEIPTDQYLLSDTVSYKENQKTITDWLFTQKLKFEPNEKYDYSNSNFLLLSMIAEKASGIKYSDYVKQNILTPLNMTNTGFYEELVDSPDLAEHHLAEGYKPMEPYFVGMCNGAGDMVSNAEDIDKWLTSLSEGTLLSEESLKEMTTDYGEGYGYGIGIDKGKNALQHTGRIATYESFVLTIPEKNINIFVVTNDPETLYNNNYDVCSFGLGILNKVNRKAVLGDVDSDKVMSIMDATAIQMHLAQVISLSDMQISCGDTDGDGNLSVLDATEIQMHLAYL